MTVSSFFKYMIICLNSISKYKYKAAICALSIIVCVTLRFHLLTALFCVMTMNYFNVLSYFPDSAGGLSNIAIGWEKCE
jgi:hypothetical protein